MTLRSLRCRAERFPEPRIQFLPAAEHKFLAGKRVEFELLDRLHNFHWVARGWDVVEPAARGEHFFVQLQNPISKRIAMSKIVKEPAIEFGVAQCSLNFSHPFCWRLLCAHWCNKGEAKNGGCDEISPVWFHQASKHGRS